MNVREATNLFLDQYKKSTRKAYAAVMIPFLEWIGPVRLLAEITEIDLLRYTNKIRQSHYAPATVRKHIKSLKTFFNWSIEMRLINHPSPMAKIKNIVVDVYIGRNKALSDEDFDKLLAFLEKNQRDNIRQRALVLTLADTGCRAGGAANLKWSDIEFERDQETKEMVGTLILTEKGEKTRPAWVFHEAVLALKKWYNAQHRTQGDFVFGYRGNQISSETLSQTFRRLCLRAGVGSHGSHKMRHRKAHQLVDEGIAPSIAATVIGDTPEVFIAHYAPKDFDSARKAASRVASRRTEQKVIPINKKTSIG